MVKINTDTTAQAQAVKNEFNTTLDKDDFLKILVAQLKHQDPLAPQDDNEFINQMTQFSSLEQVMNIGGKMEKMLEMATQSSGLSGTNAFALVGKNVEVETQDGKEVGIVDRVIKNGNDFQVEVNGNKHKAENIVAVLNAVEGESNA
ncbi:flagellar hook capping FlgD N-terminal domain-containing protein [Proteinivorax hydrogeniformans]|uniref:Flagellar hook capping FlgD N-terminal domain-containing protein n=1 Tax=Proteinivorax hydrogeniformans TaxID=1826727 RepID=A0AAU8HQV5_9FIRM